MIEIKRYQQTFQGTGASSYTFQFNRIYKRKPENKFVLRVTNLASFISGAIVAPHGIYAVGFDTGSSCNYNTQGDTVAGGDPYQNNDYLLGFVGNTNFTIGWNHNEMMLNNITTSPFTVQYKHLTSYTYETAVISLGITFEIIEYEGDATY